jgi:hypothetical protein
MTMNISAVLVNGTTHTVAIPQTLLQDKTYRRSTPAEAYATLIKSRPFWVTSAGAVIRSEHIVSFTFITT